MSILGSTLLGAGMAGGNVLTQTAYTDQFKWQSWKQATAIGGASAFASSLMGARLGQSQLFGSGFLGHLMTGAVSNAAGNLTGQMLDILSDPLSEHMSLAERLLNLGVSFAGGGAGGLISRILTRPLMDATSGLVKCGVSSFKYVVRHALGGFAGGVASNALEQAVRLHFHPDEDFSVSELLGSGIIGAATSVPAALGELCLGKACFAAGTPMRTAEGWRAIEEIRVGDLVWSRDERNPEGPLVLKEVQEVFVRTARIMALRVGGRVIRTTSEHPFWVWDRGWVPAWQLTTGDSLATEDGRWLAVEGVEDSGLWVRVYNLRIADFHTYFVGCEAWGFALWAHNTYQDLHPYLRELGFEEGQSRYAYRVFRQYGDEGLYLYLQQAKPFIRRSGRPVMSPEQSELALALARRTAADPEIPLNLSPTPTDRIKEQLFERPGKLKSQSSVRGAQIELAGGRVEAAIERGVDLDHVTKVRNAQRGLVNRMEQLRRSLNDPNLHQAQRDMLEAELSQASNLLDATEGFVPR